MRLREDGTLVCDRGHPHTFMSATWCEGLNYRGDERDRKRARERWVIPVKRITWDHSDFFVCPEGSLHIVSGQRPTLDAIPCRGKLLIVTAGIDHDGKRWVTAGCRHLHPESEVVQVIDCDH